MKKPKSKACKLVLQLMDQDMPYQDAVKQALKETKQQRNRLEKELNHYI